MSLRVLSVAYPFAPVAPDAVGGAEAVLARLDAGLCERGAIHRPSGGRREAALAPARALRRGAELALAFGRTHLLRAEDPRAAACARFDAARMVASYVDLYRALARDRLGPDAAPRRPAPKARPTQT